MIADTAFLLIVVAFLSSIKIGIKTDRVFSRLLFLCVTAVCYIFYRHSDAAVEQTFSFVWNSSPSGNIMVDIISNRYNCRLILPFLFISLLAIGYNAVFRYEERRGIFNAIILFDLTALIMMITSNNLVQLLSGLFAVDVLALLLIRDVESSKTYATLNLLADMLLFTVLAVINCQLESLDMRQILKYTQIGLHKDFVAAAGLLAVFIKLEIVPFHEGMQRLKDIRFHRLQNVLFLTSPAAALILLLKFNLLWQTSDCFLPMLTGISWLGIVWGGINLFCAENVKLKIVYMQMMFVSILLLLLISQNFMWSETFSKLLVCQYMSVSLVYYLYYQTNRTVSLLKLKVGHFSGSLFISFAYFTYLAVVWLMVIYVIDLQKAEYQQNLGVAGLLYLLSIAQLMRQFCFIRAKSEANRKTACFKILYWILTLPVIIYWIYIESKNIAGMPQITASLIVAAFIFLTMLPIPNTVYKIYACNAGQKQKGFGEFFCFVFVQPLQWIGRVLAVIIDRMVVEKIVVGFSALCLQSAVRLFRNLHYNLVGGGIIMLLMLAVLWAAAFYCGGID